VCCFSTSHPPLPAACPAQGLPPIRHYGLLASGARVENIARARQLLAVPAPEADDAAAASDQQTTALATACPCCGGRMILIETFQAGCQPSRPPTTRIDTS
jgi:hypothetical protein